VATTLLHEELLHDEQRTVARLDAVACLFEWMQALPPAERKHFRTMLAESSDAVQQVVIKHLGIIKRPETTPAERQGALKTIADALFLNADETDGEHEQNLSASASCNAAEGPRSDRADEKTNSQEAAFARRLRELMEAKRISQQELADRIQCSQPAISQMLNRACRPQKKTILKLADALGVQPRDLWPDIDVAEALDAVADFQQPGYVMSPAEAEALADTSKRNTPKVQPRSLPSHPRKQG
jgi:transcriptional regulator with XRE-family HTH domain